MLRNQYQYSVFTNYPLKLESDYIVICLKNGNNPSKKNVVKNYMAIFILLKILTVTKMEEYA